MPRGAFGQMADGYFDAQLAFTQLETLPGAIGEWRGAVELQDGFIAGVGDDLPRLLPGAAVDRQGIGEAVGRQGQPPVRAVETTFGDAVGPGGQWVTAEFAGQAGVECMAVVVA